MPRCLDPLQLSRYRFELEFSSRVELPPYKGFALRGAFGTSLKRLACTVEGEECRLCPFGQSCTYAAIFETLPPPVAGDAGKYSSYPRPFVIRPPLTRQNNYDKGDYLSFEMILVGTSRALLPHVVAAFSALGEVGFRDGQGRFTVAEVAVITGTGREETVYRGETFHSIDDHFTYADLRGVEAEVRELSLSFITPARLDLAGKLRDAPPTFKELIELILRRASLLMAFQTEIPSADDYRELLERAERVRLVDADVTWHDLERYSNRQKTKMYQGGIVGAATYRGDLGEFLPLLRLGSLVHVGKSTVFGLGRYLFAPGS